MNHTERINDHVEWMNRRPEIDEPAYINTKKMTKKVLEIAEFDRSAQRFGRLKWLSRIATGVFIASPAIDKAQDMVSEIVNQEPTIDAHIPGAIPLALGSYVASRFFRWMQNGSHDLAMEARDQLSENYGDAGLGAIRALGEANIQMSVLMDEASRNAGK